MNKQLKANFLLFTTSFIWGCAFVAQVSAMDTIGPFTFGFTRNLIGAFFLIPIIYFFQQKNKASIHETSNVKSPEVIKKDKRNLIVGGLSCGLALFIAGSIQQIGLQHTTAGKGGFITALYIVFVPICGMFLKKKVSPIIWGCVIISAVGLYLLTIKDSLTIEVSDFLVLISAIGFAIHILVIDHFSPLADGIKLSCIQFFVVSILSFIFMMFTESPIVYTSTNFLSDFINMTSPSWDYMYEAIINAWPEILYAGIMSSGIAYTLQVVAQKDTDPTIASLILSLEAVFAVIAGFFILKEMMTVRELIGCALMFGAIIIAQLPIANQPSKS